MSVTRMVSATAGVAAVCLGLAVSASAEPKKVPWKITGQLEEACTCNAACPCWFGSKPTRMTCGGAQVLFIEKGRYGGVGLNGLAVGQFVESPEGKSMMESAGNWNFTYYYIDEKANPQQREALETIAKTVFPPPSAKVEFRSVPITRKIVGKEHQITVGQYGSVYGHLVEGGLGGPARIINPPGADPLHHEYQQGQTSKLAYTDAGQKWDLKDSNYMFGTFTVDSDQYERFAAGLAQKMKAMQ